MKKVFFIFLFLPFVFTACKNTKHVKEIASIDSLKIVIDSVEKQLNIIDTTMVKSVVKEYSENSEQIRDYFKDEDKNDDSIWKAITSYGILKKPLKNFIKDFPGFYSEISFSKKQLIDLKADIKKSKIKEEKISKYTKEEAEAVNELRVQVNGSIINARENLKLYSSLNPQVERAIEKMKKHGKNKTSTKSKTEDDD